MTHLRKQSTSTWLIWKDCRKWERKYQRILKKSKREQGASHVAVIKTKSRTSVSVPPCPRHATPHLSIARFWTRFGASLTVQWGIFGTKSISRHCGPPIRPKTSQVHYTSNVFSFLFLLFLQTVFQHFITWPKVRKCQSSVFYHAVCLLPLNKTCPRLFRHLVICLLVASNMWPPLSYDKKIT